MDSWGWMTESAVALGVVDKIDGVGGGAVPNFRFAVPVWPKNGPWSAARKRRKHRKYQQKLCIEIAHNVLGTARNSVNYDKICVFGFFWRCLSCLASSDGSHQTGSAFFRPFTIQCCAMTSEIRDLSEEL